MAVLKVMTHPRGLQGLYEMLLSRHYDEKGESDSAVFYSRLAMLNCDHVDDDGYKGMIMQSYASTMEKEGKIMLEFVKSVNGIMWSYVLLFILCGTGIYFTVRLKFIQVRKFGEGCRLVFGHFKLNEEKREHGEMTPLQSLATAIAAQVGTGNLTGAATALISGGPGAIFWMWIVAFFGMMTNYSENVAGYL